MIFGRRTLVFIFILLLGLANVNFKGFSDSIPVEPIGSRGTIIVNATGGGDYTHIQWAIDNASEGDTVYVEAGTYNESIIINNTISLIGAGRDNTIISPTYDQPSWIAVEIRANWVNVSGFKIHPDYGITGVKTIHSDYVNISELNCTDGEIGISMMYTNSSIISNNICDQNIIYSIKIENSFNNIIKNNNCNSNGKSLGMMDHAGTGISLLNSDNNFIFNNTCCYNVISFPPWTHGYGIILSNSSDNTINYNNCSLNWGDGISIEGENNTICHNTCNTNRYVNNCGGGFGIYTNGFGNEIVNNSCNSNGVYGIYSRGNISYNTCDSNGKSGITSWGSGNITNNTCYSNGEYGISSGDSGSITNNYCNFNEHAGIYIYGGYIYNITHNTCNSNGQNGIWINTSSDINIINNTCNSNTYGIQVRRSDNTHIEWNFCASNNIIGIYLNGDAVSCSGNWVINNTLKSNGNCGIILDAFSMVNRIHHNNLINSHHGGIDALDYGNGNVWNSDNEGNYWSNWTTPDINGDLVVDKPYNISGNARSSDKFPLVDPISRFRPIAIAGWNAQIQQHETVIFDGSRSYGNPIVTNFSWSFHYDNQNITLFGATPTFTFHKAGIYEVVLMVFNSMGYRDADAVIISVLDIESPVANAGLDIIIPVNSTYFFNGSESLDNVGIVNHSWGFTYTESNILLYGAGPNFTFNIPGKYIVVLNVSDARGNWDTDSMKLTVWDSIWPVANAGEDITIDQHDSVSFNGSDSFDNIGIVNYTWSFTYRGEEISLYGETSAYIFDDAGSYIVILNVRDTEGHWALDSLNVTVFDITPPVANAGNNRTIIKGETVSFNANQSTDNVGIVNYSWSFYYNDTNQTLFGIDPQFKFDIQGLYKVELWVRDAANLDDRDTITIIVHPEDLPNDGNDTERPHADAGNNKTVSTNTTLSLNGTGSWDNTGVVNYTWLLKYGGKDITLYGPHPSFRFEKGGNYTIILIVRDEAGNVDDDAITVFVIEPGEVNGNDDDNENYDSDNDIEDDDTDGGGEPEEKETSTYILAGIILLAFLIAIIGIFVMYLRKQTSKDEMEEEFGRTDHKDRAINEDEDKDDDTQRKNE